MIAADEDAQLTAGEAAHGLSLDGGECRPDRRGSRGRSGLARFGLRAAGGPPADGSARGPNGGGSRPEADHDLRPSGPKHPRSRRARRPGITGAPASGRPCAPADRRRRRLVRRVPGRCIFPVVVAAPVMSPGDALTGKGHVRYSTGLADLQEADQRSPTSSCAQNFQICTALVLIGIEPAPAQNSGDARSAQVWLPSPRVSSMGVASGAIGAALPAWVICVLAGPGVVSS